MGFLDLFFPPPPRVLHLYVVRYKDGTCGSYCMTAVDARALLALPAVAEVIKLAQEMKHDLDPKYDPRLYCHAN